MTVLRVFGLEAGYGVMRVLRGVALSISAREIAVLIGHNGAGKSTVLKAIFGLLSGVHGVIELNGRRINDLGPSERIQAGLTYVPQGSRVFPELTVQENLDIATFVLPRADRSAAFDASLDLFPMLRPLLRRKAGTLSGGEQQFVALARGIIPRPRVLLLDEPSLGLSPRAAGELFEVLKRLNASSDLSILLVEQKVLASLAIADRAYVLKRGQVTFSGAASELADAKVLAERFL